MTVFRQLAVVVLGLWGLAATAQDFTALARLDIRESAVRDMRGGLGVDLYLSQPVPFRVFTLDGPKRLVMDFREIDWTGADKSQILTVGRASDLRFGVLRPGWSRLVVDLAEPMVVTQAGMTVDEVTGTAHVRVTLSRTSEAEFTARVGAPPDPDWQLLIDADPTLPAPRAASDDGLMIVAIDPGHGGIDPGAERDGLKEADIVLALGRELAEAINRTDGMRAVLTRSSDIFVPLEQRMTIARAAGADILISIHADALEEDAATGASVYTPSREAADQASQRMAERHDRGDLLAGLDLTGTDDRIATVLMDLARQKTGPQSLRFADTLVSALRSEGARVNSRPRREAVLAVLNAADFPSVLLEAGFLSSDLDRAELSTQAAREPIVRGVVTALQRWRTAEAAIQDATGN